MNSPRPSQAEETVVILQQASGQGLPVLIPGALERRVGRPTTRPASALVESGVPYARATAVDDRAQLEREREGGGAPGERTGRPPTTVLGRLWRRVFHPFDPPVM